MDQPKSKPPTPAPAPQAVAPIAVARSIITPPPRAAEVRAAAAAARNVTPARIAQQPAANASTGPKGRGGIVPALPLSSPAGQGGPFGATVPPVIPAPAAQPTTSTPTSAVPKQATPKVTADLSDTTAAVQDLAHKLSQLKPSTQTPAVAAAAPIETPQRPIRQPNNHPHMHMHTHRGRGGFRGGFQPRRVEVPSTDFDFIGSNAKFNKQDLIKEVIASEEITSPTTTSSAAAAVAPINGSAAAASNGTGAEKVESQPASGDATTTGPADGFYSKSKSFFDNISCENKERAELSPGERPRGSTWRGEETKKNIETFGQGSVDGAMGGRYGGRGGWRGGRGRGFRGYRGRGGPRGVGF